MAFYDLSKAERIKLVEEIYQSVLKDLENHCFSAVVYMEDEDTYIRKSAYLAIGKIYKTSPNYLDSILAYLRQLKSHSNEKVRQTIVNAAGELGMFVFEPVQEIFDEALFDAHHVVRNAVIGSIKKMGKKIPSRF